MRSFDSSARRSWDRKVRRGNGTDGSHGRALSKLGFGFSLMPWATLVLFSLLQPG